MSSAPASPFVPALQKKEARPIGAIVFLWLIFLWPIGSCGSMGGMRLRQATAPVVAVDAPAKLASVPLGKFVSADVRPTTLSKGEFPIGNQRMAVADGYESFGVADARDVIIIANTDLSALEHRGVVKVEGQMCDGDAVLVCQVPAELGRYVGYVEKERKVPIHVLLASAKPHGMIWEACIGLGTAWMVFLLGLVATWQVLRASRTPGALAFEKPVTLPAGPEAIRAKLRAQAGPMCRVAHDDAELFVLLVGKSMGQARLMGAREPTDIPLRVDVMLGATDAYRGSAAHVRIFALFGSPKSQVLAPAAQLAVQRASAWIVGLCETP